MQSCWWLNVTQFHSCDMSDMFFKFRRQNLFFICFNASFLSFTWLIVFALSCLCKWFSGSVLITGSWFHLHLVKLVTVHVRKIPSYVMYSDLCMNSQAPNCQLVLKEEESIAQVKRVTKNLSGIADPSIQLCALQVIEIIEHIILYRGQLMIYYLKFLQTESKIRFPNGKTRHDWNFFLLSRVSVKSVVFNLYWDQSPLHFSKTFHIPIIKKKINYIHTIKV